MASFADLPFRRRLLAVAMVLILPSVLPAQKVDLQAFNEARRAQEAKNYPDAIRRYRDFLNRHADAPEAAAARFGLGVCLLEGQRDYAGAVEQLQAAAAKDLPEKAAVLRHLGIAQRGLGMRELAQAAAQPKEAAKHQEAAKQRFDEAARQFSAAAEAFRRGDKPDAETAARARCDQAEMLLHIDRARDARDLVTPLLKDAALEKSPVRRLALYYHGWANLALDDYHAAGRSLTMLAPFGDAAFGLHARFLLARVHHQQDERAEAAAHYDAVITKYEKQKKAAPQLLNRGETKKNPLERARLEALVQEPPPEYVARSGFYLGVLQFEGGRFGDAAPRFATFLRQFPRSPLAPAAQLRLGACQVEARQFPEAVQTLTPVAEKEPVLSEQAYGWLAKAWLGLVDPRNPQGNPQAVQKALEAQRHAADKARERAATDADAKGRLGQVLLDRVDLLLLVGQHREAVASCRQLLADQLLPRREAEILQRLAAGLSLAGDYAESEKVCARFLQEHPHSLLLPAVLFRHAENAAFLYQAAEKDPARQKDLPRLNDEVARRYQELFDRFGDFEYIGRVRFGLAMCLFRKGQLEKAKDMLESISPSDHVDDLAVVPYLMTDWLIRLTPARADDALQAAKMQEHLTTAIPLLQNFVNTQQRHPLAPDAVLKLGLCKQRLALLAANPGERNNQLGSSGRRFMLLIQNYPQDERVAQARLELVRCKALAGDVNTAIAELKRFTNDPILQESPVAALAALQLAALLRAQNRPGDAVPLLAQCRQKHEAALLKDPKRLPWAVQLQLAHGICLKEAGQFAEARPVFAGLAHQFADRPEAAEALLRLGQCLKDEAVQKIEKGQPAENDIKALRDAVAFLESQAEALKKKAPEAEARARMLYDAAWACRVLAGTEAGQQKPSPSEKKARDLYQAMIADFTDLPLANDARLELAELLIERGEHDAAVKWLDQALDREPPPELTDKVRLLLGRCRAAKGDNQGAQGVLALIAKNGKSPFAGEARKQMQALKENKPLPELPKLGTMVADRASLEDVTPEFSLALALEKSPVGAKTPVPFLRITLPDPYAYHSPNRLESAHAREAAAGLGAWPAGSY